MLLNLFLFLFFHLLAIRHRIDLNGHKSLRSDQSFPGQPWQLFPWPFFLINGPLRDHQNAREERKGRKVVESNYMQTSIYQIIWFGKKLGSFSNRMAGSWFWLVSVTVNISLQLWFHWQIKLYFLFKYCFCFILWQLLE